MRMSEAGKAALTKPFEGLRLTAYPDPASGKEPWTIGFGHTKGVYQGLACTVAQANEWLDQDLLDAEEAVSDLVKVSLNQNQFDAVVDFTFNLGRGHLSQSTLLRDLNNGEYDKAADEFLKWVYGGGKVMPGLVTRRKAEREWFLKGG